MSGSLEGKYAEMGVAQDLLHIIVNLNVQMQKGLFNLLVNFSCGATKHTCSYTQCV